MSQNRWQQRQRRRRRKGREEAQLAMARLGLLDLHMRQSNESKLPIDQLRRLDKTDRRKKVYTSDDEWYSPKAYVNIARGTMDTIDLDPASSRVANETVQATLFYSIAHNGLTHPWFGNVWLAPPYSYGQLDEFITKLIKEYRSTRVTQACVLTYNGTETQWFAKLNKVAKVVCFPTGGRMTRFSDPDGDLRPRWRGDALWYVGPNVNANKFIGYTKFLGPRYIPSSRLSGIVNVKEK